MTTQAERAPCTMDSHAPGIEPRDPKMNDGTEETEPRNVSSYRLMVSWEDDVCRVDSSASCKKLPVMYARPTLGSTRKGAPEMCEVLFLPA